MNRIGDLRARISATPTGERSDRAGLAVAAALIICFFTWALFLSAMVSELSGATGPSYRVSYLAAGALGLFGIIATAVAGLYGRTAIRTAAAATFWMLLCPTLWTGQIIVALIER